MYVVILVAKIKTSRTLVRLGNYSHALKLADLETLKHRRKGLCLTFARRSLKNEATKDIFPINDNKNKEKIHNSEKYQVYSANTKRLQDSPIIYMQHLLNEYHSNDPKK